MAFLITAVMGAASAWPTPSLTAEVPAMPVDAAPVPAGAIPVGEDVYMVPVGADRDGCGQFRMFSTKSAVVDAIFYRDRKGGFTMNRHDADCPPPGGR